LESLPDAGSYGGRRHAGSLDYQLRR
jgi:hypothetical protein